MNRIGGQSLYNKVLCWALFLIKCNLRFFRFRLVWQIRVHQFLVIFITILSVWFIFKKRDTNNDVNVFLFFITFQYGEIHIVHHRTYLHTITLGGGLTDCWIRKGTILSRLPLIVALCVTQSSENWKLSQKLWVIGWQQLWNFSYLFLWSYYKYGIQWWFTLDKLHSTYM